jgi:hypothetical protein
MIVSNDCFFTYEQIAANADVVSNVAFPSLLCIMSDVLRVPGKVQRMRERTGSNSMVAME